MIKFSASPLEIVKSFSLNWPLLYSLTKRDVESKYRESFLGFLWSFVTPLLFLAIYTFVFGVVFKARWPVGEVDSKMEFAFIIFTGFMLFNIFSETISRAPTIILSHQNFVKKVVFPLEILPAVALGGSLFNALVSFIVWLIFYIFNFGLPHPTLLLLPLIMFPLICLTLGVSWFFAALGVFVRDITHIVGLLTTALLFLSGIFFSAETLPPEYQEVLSLNPFLFIISQARQVMIWGKLPDFAQLAIYTGFSLVLAWLGFVFFQKTRKGFADVL
ncbi:MAG: ABC transporter permease [Alphaproteobacteria bacterium]|jgi:lipopolysaccharide transport system permease protein|nr:ABC transporter permease [Alphaproteobacteria bacterium]